MRDIRERMQLHKGFSVGIDVIGLSKIYTLTLIIIKRYRLWPKVHSQLFESAGYS